MIKYQYYVITDNIKNLMSNHVRFYLVFLFTLIGQFELLGQAFERTNQNLSTLKRGSIDWGDYDNDGDLDLLMSGGIHIDGDYKRKTQILKNDASEGFVEVFVDQITGITSGNSLWVDINRDGLLDIFLTGDSSEGSCGGCTSISEIYLNTGNGFQLSFENEIPGYGQGMALFGDLDNDADLDIVISGVKEGFASTEVYLNKEDGFKLDPNNSFPGLNFANIDLGDFDNDGDEDILLAGVSESNIPYTGIFVNENGVFTELINSGLKNATGTIGWFDFNSDGKMDVILSGLSDEQDELGNFLNFTNIFENKGGIFQEINGTSLTKGQHKHLEPGDFDNDGDLDILIIGDSNNGSQVDHVFEIFENNSNSFVALPNESLIGISSSSGKWGDYDNDGDLDLFVNGSLNNGSSRTDVIRNLTDTKNTLPVVPDGLSVEVIDDFVKLSWNRASDVESSQNGLTYNVHLRDASNNIIPSNSLSSGKRTIVDTGNSGQNTFIKVRSLTPGDYYWKVQALDNSFAGSLFSEEFIFHVNFPPIVTEASVFTTSEESPIQILINDFVVDDPDNTFPDDFLLSITNGENYSVSGNEIIPDKGFFGTLIVPVIINDGTDNSDPFPLSIEVTRVLGVMDGSLNNNFSIYPNPTSTSIRISSSVIAGPYEAKILGASGRAIYSIQELKNSIENIDLSDLKNGLYIIKVTSEDKIEIMKILKK